MTDEQLAKLFTEGTAPERDEAFVGRTAAQIGFERLASRFLSLALPALIFVMLLTVIFVAVRTIEPLLAPIAQSSPQFMGVPVPLALGALALGLVAYAWRFVRLSFL